jgi:hypothetical protein
MIGSEITGDLGNDTIAATLHLSFNLEARNGNGGVVLIPREIKTAR